MWVKQAHFQKDNVGVCVYEVQLKVPPLPPHPLISKRSFICMYFIRHSSMLHGLLILVTRNWCQWVGVRGENSSQSDNNTLIH